MNDDDWSEELKNFTRKYFIENNAGFVKSKEARSGILYKKPDELNCMIVGLRNSEVLRFITLDDAILSGWVVD
jgi:hypothetical protein